MNFLTRPLFAVAVSFLAWGLPTAKADETAAQGCTATGAELAKLMEKTQVGAVMDYDGLPSDYKADGNPDTLELVFMKKAKGLASSVSNDGEVIFLVGKVKDAEQSKLIELAFCRRAVARRG